MRYQFSACCSKLRGGYSRATSANHITTYRTRGRFYMAFMRRMMLGALAVAALSGCSTHDVDTVPEWCEQISGVDITEKYAPFWADFPGVRFHGDAIRDDFVRSMNEVAMQ